MSWINQIQTVASALLPQKTVDTNPVNTRSDGYGNIAVNTYFNKKQALAAEGTYFVITNPTPGTGVGAGPYPTTYANTAPWFIFQNWNAPGGATAYPDYLKIIISTAIGGGTVTGAHFSIIRDIASPLLLQVTTSTSLSQASPVNVNGGSSNRSNCVLGYQGGATALVAKAPSQASAIIGRSTVSVGGSTGTGLAGEEIVLDFGATDPAPLQGLTATSAVAFGRKVAVLPPVAVPPQQQIIIIPWWPGATTSGLNYEFELGFVEK